MIELQSIAPMKLTRRLRFTSDCGRVDFALLPIAAAKKSSRLRVTADCARRFDTGFILEKKSGAIVGTFVANYRRLRPADGRTDGRTLFQFRQLYI